MAPTTDPRAPEPVPGGALPPDASPAEPAAIIGAAPEPPAPPAGGTTDPARRHRRSLFAPTLLKIAGMLALAAALGLALAWIYARGSRHVRPLATGAVSGAARTFLPPVPPRLTILLLGTDKKIDINRTDTLILVVLDTKNCAIDAISVLRDTYVDTLPIHVKKLNGVYANALIKTKDERAACRRACDAVARIVGLPVDHYVRVDLDGFVRVVDLLGGVDVYVDKDMKYDDFSQNLHIDLKKGYQHLNGERAQQFVRFRRDADGDRARAERQQRFLRALLRRVASPGVLLNLPDVVRGVLSEILTDLPLDRALALATHYLESDRITLATHTLPGEYEKRDELDYFIHHPRKTQELVRGILDPARFLAVRATAETDLQPAPPPAPGKAAGGAPR